MGMKMQNTFYCEVFKVCLKDAKLNLLSDEFNYCMPKFCVCILRESEREREMCLLVLLPLIFFVFNVLLCVRTDRLFVYSFV